MFTNKRALRPWVAHLRIAFVWILFVSFVHVCLCYAVLSVPCSFVTTCWERAELDALLHMMLSGVFVTFPSGVVLYCIDS